MMIESQRIEQPAGIASIQQQQQYQQLHHATVINTTAVHQDGAGQTNDCQASGGREFAINVGLAYQNESLDTVEHVKGDALDEKSSAFQAQMMSREEAHERRQSGARDQRQQQQAGVLKNKLRNIVIGLLAKKKETKMDNLEAMINESALKLLQQKELVFKQASCMQLEQLCKSTKFTRRELKWLYSGWKVACTDGCGVNTDSLSDSDHSYGIINEQQFQQIYAQFFPYGGDCSYYAKYVFQAMFSETLAKNGGFITFADYAHALSSLLRGSIDEKIEFVFKLYDLNNDNVITIDELSRIFFAVYRLLGDNVNEKHDQLTYEQQAERLYNKIDLEQSGSITREQFIDYCKRNSSIVDTIQSLEMSICSSA